MKTGERSVLKCTQRVVFWNICIIKVGLKSFSSPADTRFCGGGHAQPSNHWTAATSGSPQVCEASLSTTFRPLGRRRLSSVSASEPQIGEEVGQTWCCQTLADSVSVFVFLVSSGVFPTVRWDRVSGARSCQVRSTPVT